MDIDEVPFASDFRETITTQIKETAVCLVLIGPRWLEVLQQRFNEPRDFVRIELETAPACGVKLSL